MAQQLIINGVGCIDTVDILVDNIIIQQDGWIQRQINNLVEWMDRVVDK